METYNMNEYERGDSTIDPLTASAEYEIEKKTEALDKFHVEISKGFAFFYFFNLFRRKGTWYEHCWYWSWE